MHLRLRPRTEERVGDPDRERDETGEGEERQEHMILASLLLVRPGAPARSVHAPSDGKPDPTGEPKTQSFAKDATWRLSNVKRRRQTDRSHTQAIRLNLLARGRPAGEPDGTRIKATVKPRWLGTCLVQS